MVVAPGIVEERMMAIGPLELIVLCLLTIVVVVVAVVMATSRGRNDRED